MRSIPISVFRTMSKDTILEARPFLITFDGDILGTFVDPNSVLVLEGMHPAARRRFRAKEQLIRTAQGSTVYP